MSTRYSPHPFLVGGPKGERGARDGINHLELPYNAIADSDPGLSDANTFAGQMYGEIIGTFIPTPVELTVNLEEGSDLGHWCKNPTFDNEIGV